MCFFYDLCIFIYISNHLMFFFQKFLITMYDIIHFDTGVRERDISNPLYGIRTPEQPERKEKQVKICSFSLFFFFFCPLHVTNIFVSSCKLRSFLKTIIVCIGKYISSFVFNFGYVIL